MVMEADSEGLSSKTSPVLDSAPSKENINKTSKVGGESPTPGSVDEEIVMYSMVIAIDGVMVTGAAPGKLSG